MTQNKTVSTGRALRRLLVFQIKLALDALRDFALSPLSIAAFLLDALLRRPEQESLFFRLMALGRRSDRVINLFDEFGEGVDYTVDQTLSEVEKAVQPHWQDVKRRYRGGGVNGGGDADSP